MNIVIASMLTLTGLGVLFGLSLAYAARKFSIPVDPTLEKILAKLPGANCGACGKAGCMGFAQALLAGELDVTTCSVAAEQSKKDIAGLLGLSLKQKAKLVSCLHCCGGHHAKEKYLYGGMKDCLAVSLVLGGQKECKFGCLTYGTCAKACPFGAIEMTSEGFPRVIESKCTACGVCVNVCPKGLYSLVPFNPSAGIPGSALFPQGEAGEECGAASGGNPRKGALRPSAIRNAEASLWVRIIRKTVRNIPGPSGEAGVPSGGTHPLVRLKRGVSSTARREPAGLPSLWRGRSPGDSTAQDARIYVACSSKDTGKTVMDVCGVGCIACRRCEKACAHGAITVVDNLARIDYEKCTGCLECAKVCPTKVIKIRAGA